jgi:phenylalanyl-tRNA synthetase alpha chain
LKEVVDRVLGIERYAEFDIVEAPEIVPAHVSFDLFNFPQDHPARSPSDTYFVDSDHILRTHTTVMWYYHIQNDHVQEKIRAGKPVGAHAYGKVYRRDEIDRSHMPVFHQIDGWYLCRRKDHMITVEDLQEVLGEMARAIYGRDTNYRFNEDQFPYTDPSLEMEVEVRGRWIEVLGAGVVRGEVLKNFGVDPNEYNGWAYGPGLERLAMVSMDLPDIRLFWSQDERIKKQLRLGHTFKEVSKYPPISRDISFVVEGSFVPNEYFDLIRDIGGELVEEVTLIDKFENAEKFGEGKTSYTYRIVYRSNERTLTTEEIDPIQERIYRETAAQFGARLR